MTVSVVIAIPRPTPIHAVRYDGGFESYNEVSKWIQSQPKPESMFPSCGFSVWYGGFGPGGRFILFTTSGEMEVDPGDYIVRNVRGEYVPVKPNAFKRDYFEQYSFTGNEKDNDQSSDRFRHLRNPHLCKDFVRVE